jgi:hypothetical protein
VGSVTNEEKGRRARETERKSVKVKFVSICFLFRLPGPEISARCGGSGPAVAARTGSHDSYALIYDYHYPTVIMYKTGFQDTSIFTIIFCNVPVEVTARSKAPTVFDLSNTGIAGSNPSRGMELCSRFSVSCCRV